MQETGQISINTENILPIIKKWLYSEKEIFIREVVSNAADAIFKLEKIAAAEDCEDRRQEPRIDINVDKDKRIVTVSDTGLGMTSEEIKRYINQVAFSGVKDFVEKYQGKDDQEQVIGHFGLGFYSSFMVAEKVEIDSLSYRRDSVPAHWESVGDSSYKLGQGTRSEVGTTITLHIDKDNDDILDAGQLKQLVNKYCAFMKYPVFLQGEQISDPRPAWTQNASQLKDEDYKAFFQKVFPFQEEPLFWVHLNLDYPLKLRGVLFFPRLGHEMSASEGQVKLYCNQVFVEDNCKELIPEYLTLLKGVIDCPDLPLNVSRSALQKDQNVKKIAQHITKKVADKFAGMFKTKREEYEAFWEDVNPFVKYAMIRDSDFCERMLPYLVYKTTNEKYLTMDEYLEAYGEKTDKRILYANDPGIHVNFIKMLQGEGIEAFIANRVLDQHFLPYIEMSHAQKYKFQRVDADVSKYLAKDASDTEIVDPNDNKTVSQKLEAIFKQHLGREDLKVRVDSLKHAEAPAVLIIDENMRRLREMSRSSDVASFASGLGANTTLVINKNSTAIKNLLNLASTFNRDEDVKLMVQQIYDLASLQQGNFEPKAMQAFIERSSTLLARVGI